MEVHTEEFKLGGHTFSLRVSPTELFMPNAVTRLFSKTVRIDPNDIVFDIGSGVGPIAIWAALEEPSANVSAVEVVQEQYELLRENITLNRVDGRVRAYCGSFFDPIPQDIRANVIIADVSGIAKGPARVLGWYPPEIPTGGEDGTEVIIEMLEQAGSRLVDGGRLYFPVAVGLSDHEKIMSAARSKFARLEERVNVSFPLTPEQVKCMKQYKSIPYIKLEDKGSRTIWRGRIYEATEPK